MPSLPDAEGAAHGAAATALVDGVRRAVDARLDVLLAEAEQRAALAGEEPRAVAAALATLVRRGGKRLRPALVAAAFEACGGGSGVASSAVVDAGASWELLQAYFLVHDDWMDGDVTRRGGPTVHVVLSERHRNAHLGASLAILAGDLACALAHRVLVGIDAPGEVTRDALSLFSRVHEEVVLGQALDLTLGAHDAAAVERMHALKTGSYTVRGPLLMGATLARASEPARNALERFAAPLGVAFQLRDDLLGVFGSEAETGKPVGSDLRAGKRTAVIAEALRASSNDERARIEAVLAGDASDANVEWARAHLDRTARPAVEARISALVGEARTAITDAPLTPAGASVLLALATRLAERRA